MKVIRAVWQDLTRGRHIIDYFLILAAFVLPALNLLRIVPTERLVTTTLPILGLLIAKAVSNTWRESGDIQIHEDWSGEVYDAIASAKKSVVILTSWVVDASTIGDRVHAACRRTAQLRVDVFMLDPDKPFGPQRYGEVNEPGKDYEPAWEREYREQFNHSVKTFRGRLTRCTNVDLNFYKYPTMPHLKICAIDDERFFISWLPIDEPSTKNVCVELSVNSASPGALIVINKLKEHLSALRGRSTRVAGALQPHAPGAGPERRKTETQRR